MCLYMFKALEDKFNPYPPGVQFASYHMGTSSPGTTDPLARLRVLCFLVLPLSLCFLILALDHPTPFPSKLLFFSTLLLFSSSAMSNSLRPHDCSTPGFPVLHHLLEFAQTHVCWVSDAIQPSHPLSSPSPPAFNLSQHQGLFQWVGSLHQMAKALEL